MVKTQHAASLPMGEPGQNLNACVILNVYNASSGFLFLCLMLQKLPVP